MSTENAIKIDEKKIEQNTNEKEVNAILPSEINVDNNTDFNDIVKVLKSLSFDEQSKILLKLDNELQSKLLPFLDDETEIENFSDTEKIRIETDMSITDCLINSGIVHFIKSQNKFKKHIIDRNCLFLYKEIKDMTPKEKIDYGSYKRNLKSLKKDIKENSLKMMILNPALVKINTCFEFIIPLHQFQIDMINKLEILFKNPVFKEIELIIKKLDETKLYTKIIEKEI